MDTSDTRVTRTEAADAVGVAPRTINRWSAAGIISVRRPLSGSPTPATYSLREVEETARERRAGKYAPGFDPDILT